MDVNKWSPEGWGIGVCLSRDNIVQGYLKSVLTEACPAKEGGGG